MILNNQNSEPIGYPSSLKLTNDYTKFKTLFIVDPVFYFNTTAEFQTREYWIGGISAGYIIPIHEIFEVDDRSDDAVYNLSKHNYYYKITSGKYAFVLRVRYDIDIYNKLLTYSGKKLKAYFADYNLNYYGYYNGTEVHPFDLDIIDIKKIKIGTESPVFTEIFIQLYNWEEVNYIYKNDFYLNDLIVQYVTILDISSSPSNTLSFQVVNYCEIPITNLIQSDFTIVDEVYGSVTPTDFSNDGDGYYTFTWTSDFTTGDITIDTERYYGIGTYAVYVVPVTIDNFTQDTVYDMSFDVTNDDTSNPVTNLSLSDISSIIDSESGTLVISSFINNGGGNYTIIATEQITSGDITINSIRYTGSDSYSLGSPLTQLTISGIDSEVLNQIYFTVTQTATGTPVTTLTESDFTITDNLSGELTFDYFNHVIDGLYLFVSYEGISSGSIVIDDGTYSGNTTYDERDISIVHQFIFDSWSGSGYNQYPTGWTVTSDDSWNASNYMQDDTDKAHHYIDLAGGSSQVMKTDGGLETSQSYYLLFNYKTAHTIVSPNQWFGYGAKNASVADITNIYLGGSADKHSKLVSLTTALSNSYFTYVLNDTDAFNEINFTMYDITIYKLNT